MALMISKGSVTEQLCASVELPKMIRVKQKFDPSHIEPGEIPGIIEKQFSREEIGSAIRPGMRIAITCGSRGVANIPVVIRAVADELKKRGALPFVFPAMGSHGGAVAEGQRQILESYGVTEETAGCPVISSMETVSLGFSEEGNEVFIDRAAHEADGIVLCGRIKAHTCFRGPYESGLVKMAVIGMGKQHGAETVHQFGFGKMSKMLQATGRVIFEKSNIVAGVGLIENAYEQTCQIHTLTKEEIWEKEPELLRYAKSRMGRIWIEKADVLVVDRIGKNFSGDGMDPNVTGTFAAPESADDGSEGPIRAQRTVVLDISDETHGNANGVGTADITTKRLVDRMDADATFPNAVTSTLLETVRIPIFTCSDRSAVCLAVRSMTEGDKEHPRIVRIANSMELDEIWVSEALLPEVEAHPDLEPAGSPEPWPFDGDGNLW